NQITEKMEFDKVEDDNDWAISIKVPLIPETKRDATEWVNYLLVNRLKDKSDAYITRDELNRDMLMGIIENSPITSVFEDWYFSVDGFIEGELRNNKPEIYKRIMACDDLLFDQSLISISPTEWKKVMIVVDGSNVAWNHGSRERGDKPLVKNIEIMVNSLQKKGFKRVVVYCDANLRYEVPDKSKYEELIQKDILRSVPSKTIADYFIIDFAQRYDLFIVTGDKYSDWKEKAEKYGWYGDIKIKNFDIYNNEAIAYNLEVV
ncbi:MAG: hypothetical protein J7L08_04090, partial [Candidatus Aenigmarchaeota archaeon]|nr:hypothetical protein [Candidatus Aenigmarchaeota archaeon]